MQRMWRVAASEIGRLLRLLLLWVDAMSAETEPRSVLRHERRGELVSANVDIIEAYLCKMASFLMCAAKVLAS